MKTFADRRGLGPLLAGALAAIAPCSVAFAQQPSASDVAQARELYNQGKSLRNRGDNVGALEKLKAAHAIAATPLTGLELGQTYSLLGKLIDAQEAFLSVARIPVRPEETARSAEARRESAKLAEETRARIPSLVIKVTGVPIDTVAVTVDGAAVASQALAAPRFVDPGSHVISAHSTTGGTAETRVDLKEGESRTVELTITFTGSAPVAAQTAPSGSIWNTATAATPPPQPSGGMSTLRVLGLVSGGAGVAGLVVGGIFGAMAGSASSDQQSACPSPTNCPNHAQAVSDHSTFETDSTIEVAGFVAGGVLLAGGIAMFVMGGNKGEPESRNTALVVTPAISPGSAGLTLFGEF
jgi:hypothetical protein